MTIKYCTPETPYTAERDEEGDRWQHSKVSEIGDQENGWPGGDIVTYRCDNCGVKWKAELPQ